MAILLVGLSAALFHALVGRLLGPRALGAAGVGLALGLGGAQVVTAGLAPAITRFAAARLAAGDRAGARRSLAGGLGSACLLGLALAGLLLLASPLTARLDLPAELRLPAAALLWLQCLYIAGKAALYGLGRVGPYARAELPAALAFGLTLGLLSLQSGDASGWLLSPFLAANLVFVAGAAWLLVRAWPRGRSKRSATSIGPRSAPLGSDSASTRAGSSASRPTEIASSRLPAQREGDSMLRYALIASVGSAAALARLQLVVLLTAALWPPAEVGMLQAALTLLPPVLLLPRALELALLPRLAGDWGGDDPAAFRRRASLATRISALGLAMVAGGLGLAAGWLLPALFGAGFAPALPALRWTLLAAACLGLAAPAVTALSGADGVRLPNAAGLAGLLTSLAAWALWLPAGGATAAAAGLALGSLVNAGIPLVAAARRYGLDWQPTAGLLLRASLLLALAAGLLGSGLLGPSAQHRALPAIAISLAYLLALGLLEGPRLLPTLTGHAPGAGA